MKHINHGELQKAKATAYAAGQGATRVVHQALYGTRRGPYTTASERRPDRPVIGVGVKSVFQGPQRAAQPGAPILRRL